MALNYGGAASGAISGASTGFGLGGPIGGAIGGVGGAIAGLFGGGRKKKKKGKLISSFDPMQKNLNEQQHQSILGKGPLADLYNYDPQGANTVFEQTIANPAYRSFQEKLAPTITGQFRNQGLQNSSYVGDALSKAGRDVQESLNAQRSQYLYGEQENARNAKRNAVENLQNRNTQQLSAPRPQSQQSGGFDIGNILSQFNPGTIDNLKGTFNGLSNMFGSGQKITNSGSGPGGSYSTVSG